MKNSKNDLGITLVALAVTIVVLIILAGISINAIGGNDGLIDRAKETKNTVFDTQTQTETGLNEVHNTIRSQTVYRDYDEMLELENVKTRMIQTLRNLGISASENESAEALLDKLINALENN